LAFSGVQQKEKVKRLGIVTLISIFGIDTLLGNPRLKNQWEAPSVV
jgi:hypothetical protein